MALPKGFDPYRMTLNVNEPLSEQKKRGLPENFDPLTGRFTNLNDGAVSEASGDTPIVENNGKKLAEVRAKLHDKEKGVIDGKNEKELSADEIQTSIEHHAKNAENNNTIASIAKISKLKESCR